MGKLQSYTVPSIKRQLLKLCNAERVDMFAQHPEPGSHPSIHDALDRVHPATARALEIREVFSVRQAFFFGLTHVIWSLARCLRSHRHCFLLSCLLLHLIFVRKYLWVYHACLIVRLVLVGLAVHDYQLVCFGTEVHERLKLAKVLHF